MILSAVEEVQGPIKTNQEVVMRRTLENAADGDVKHRFVLMSSPKEPSKQQIKGTAMCLEIWINGHHEIFIHHTTFHILIGIQNDLYLALQR